ncbi:MAG: signal peptide peptidase SppA [Gemmatimonas sp.]
MKQFFAALAANLVTIAILVVGSILLVIGIAASAAGSRGPTVRDGSVLILNLESALSDAPANFEPKSAFEGLLEANVSEKLPLRSAIKAIGAAANDDHISGILIRGNVTADGYGSGYAALKELREALIAFHATSKKPVHAYLVNALTKDYYLASAASTITLDPFGSLMIPGLASEEVFFAGFLEKYGIGIQVSKVGKYKSAVEPYIRKDMSPENRQQVKGYLGDLWSEVRRGISATRKIDTLAFQQLVDREGILQPDVAKASGLVDRVAYFDEVLADLQALAKSSGAKKVVTSKEAAKALAETATVAAAPEKPDSATSGATKSDSTKPVARKSVTDMPASLAALMPSLPQIDLTDYAPMAAARAQSIGIKQSVAIVYAEGDIVDGEGGPGMIGGDALARALRKIRTDDDIAAVVLRVNSPGGSAIASETIQRELALIKLNKPVVVSMGTVAASGGYWITTAASRVFAEPNTITGSIGVFSLIPNVKTIAANHGITFDTVKTGKYADLYTTMRPRTADEMAILQRSTDAIYNAFIDRVSKARHLTTDSVRVIAEGRVWSGEDAIQVGLVDSLGNLDAAIKSAAAMARIVGEYNVRELPRGKSATEALMELFDRKSPPVAKISTGLLAGRDPVRTLARDMMHELDALLTYNDPRNVYARMPYLLRIR